MRTFALIGDPIAQSPSPRMHNAAFDAVALDARYELVPVPQDNTEKLGRVLRDNRFSGFNVTTPHKIQVASRVSLEAEAERAGAVNTLVGSPEGWTGYLTDVHGVMTPLLQESLHKSGVGLVLGSGGAARAACLALERLGLSVHVAARRRGPAEMLCQTVLEKTDDSCVHDLAALENALLGEVSVVVQATPVGRGGERHALNWNALPSHTIAFEMLYLPRVTPFLEDARARQLKTIEGWQMLLHQGAESFRLWTGVTPPIEAMRNALLSEL